MKFVPWPEITSFSNIRKYTSAHPEILGEQKTVKYKCKVKLHGTNAAVQVLTDGSVAAQSRERLITPTDDNMGFARWVEQNRSAWTKIKFTKDLVVFGEWCGPGIMKDVAINLIDRKIFAVFAVLFGDNLIIDPEQIKDIVPTELVYVLPWYENGLQLDIPWTEPAEDLRVIVDAINHEVEKVENCDPWVKNTFDKYGIGEGLVWYPISHLGQENFTNLVFKAKGEKHKVVATSKAVQLEPAKAAGIDDFVILVLTEARLEQGVRAISNGELVFEKKNTGNFIKWIVTDLVKEVNSELEASKLTWAEVRGPIEIKARKWYLSHG